MSRIADPFMSHANVPLLPGTLFSVGRGWWEGWWSPVAAAPWRHSLKSEGQQLFKGLNRVWTEHVKHHITLTPGSIGSPVMGCWKRQPLSVTPSTCSWCRWMPLWLYPPVLWHSVQLWKLKWSPRLMLWASARWDCGLCRSASWFLLVSQVLVPV